jgi:hypothetical protein
MGVRLSEVNGGQAEYDRVLALAKNPPVKK